MTLSTFDRLITDADRFLRSLSGAPLRMRRPLPEPAQETRPLAARERARSIGLMRVNHAGEVAAQALYRGQACVARDPAVARALDAAGDEEADHLVWCEARLRTLDARPSLLNPLWYAGAFALGAGAGLAGDRWSLGLVAESERQVVRHLDKHLRRLPAGDTSSRAILEQMQHDEAEHAADAEKRGAHTLPAPVPALMRATARIMTRTAAWL